MRHQSRLHHCHNIDNLREAARKRLPRFVYDYLEGGADDEFTLTRRTLGRSEFGDKTGAGYPMKRVHAVGPQTVIAC